MVRKRVYPDRQTGAMATDHGQQQPRQWNLLVLGQVLFAQADPAATGAERRANRQFLLLGNNVDEGVFKGRANLDQLRKEAASKAKPTASST